MWKVCKEVKNLEGHLKRFMNYEREFAIVQKAIKAESIEEARKLSDYNPMDVLLDFEMAEE